MPGGVNSPVRSFRSVGKTPFFVDKAAGAFLIDVDHNRYLDYVCSWGPGILGHAHPAVIEAVCRACEKGLTFGAPTEKEVELAELVNECVPSMEMMRLVSSGTEACMSAIRAARGFTGRDKIIKFEGCYHGHSDGLLVKAGSGLMTEAIPDSAGVPAGYAENTLLAVYNDPDSVFRLFDAYRDQIACVIVEPVAANMGVVPPAEGFLPFLREITEKNGALLIFDEVITGFRLSLGGAQEYYKVRPDLSTFGKIIGGGMPLAAYGGRRDVMSCIAPLGPVYQAGTLSGNPVAMTAGLTQLKYLYNNPKLYEDLKAKGEKLYGGMQELLYRYQVPYTVNYVDSLGCMFCTSHEVSNYALAKTSDTAAFADYFAWMINHGYHLASSQFEAMFLSEAHTDEIIDETLNTVEDYLRERKE